MGMEKSELDLSNYATKAAMTVAKGIDTFTMASKIVLVKLK